MREAGRVESICEEDALRARFYALLARLLAQPPGAGDLESLARMEGDRSEMGQALAALARVAARVSPAEADDEYATLFIGLTEGELRPYKSFYLTGFLYEKPLADVRRDMTALGMARAAGVAEPEDHVAALCEMMHGLIMGAFDTQRGLLAQQSFFRAHLEPWAPRFFHDLETARSAVLYGPVGTVGRLFMAIEREAFAMAD